MNIFLRRILLALLDAPVVVASLCVSILIHYEGRFPAMYLDAYYSLFFLFVIVKLTVFQLNGLYNRVWRYASIDDLVHIIRAVVIASLIITSLLFFQRARFPRTVLFLDFFITLFLIGLIRLGIRIRHEYFLRARPIWDARPVVVIGAGDAGEMIIREMIKHPELGFYPVGILDDDRTRHGLRIHGVEVLGNTRKLNEVVLDYEIREVILAIPSASGKVMRRIIRHCRTQGVKFKTLPGVYELIDGSVHVSQIRDIRIEDLLGREPVDLDLDAIQSTLAEKTVLVTGAGGSIGSQLCREIAHFGPRLIIMLGRGENSIYRLAQEFDRDYPQVDKALIIGSVTDEEKLRDVFRRHRPDVVFHAAAHKHVPLMELHPDEAIKNNVFGTRLIAEIAEQAAVETFVLVSTDKAVYPSSVMGASKRLAELTVQSRGKKGRTRFVVVRFGNVLGSRGSVVPLFMEQIQSGGPVTITHPDMERYFMTIPEAAKLVIEAQAMAQGGEIYILDMGEPVKILDLAKDLIRLSGYEPGEDIRIQFTGLRPGEKLSEELLTREEESLATRHRKIFTAPRLNAPRSEVDRLLDELRSELSLGDPAVARQSIMEALSACEKLRSKSGKNEKIVKLYEDDLTTEVHG